MRATHIKCGLVGPGDVTQVSSDADRPVFRGPALSASSAPTEKTRDELRSRPIRASRALAALAHPIRGLCHDIITAIL